MTKQIAQRIDEWTCDYCGDEATMVGGIDYEDESEFSRPLCDSVMCYQKYCWEDPARGGDCDELIRTTDIETSALASLCPYCRQEVNQYGYCDDRDCRGAYYEDEDASDWYRAR